jgi:hypothetical protein
MRSILLKLNLNSPEVSGTRHLKMEPARMIQQNTDVLDILLDARTAERFGVVYLSTLWPNRMQRLSINRWAGYLVAQDIYTRQHLLDINTWFTREDEDQRLKRLTYMLVNMVYQVRRQINNPNIDLYVQQPANYDNLFGLPALKGIFMEAEKNKKVVDYLRAYENDLNDGELGYALTDEFIKEVGRAMDRQRKGFYMARKQSFAPLKESLMAAAWHPKRVEAILDTGGFELLEALQ